ncbi:MAG: putative transposase [Oleiphilaceae bacterium]|jgi:putative transposase
MSNSSEIRKGRRCVFLLHAHLVFITKYRYKVLTGYMMPSLQKLFEGVCDDFEAELIEFDGESDHVHLLINYPPKVQLSKLVNSLKGVSSRKLKILHPEVSKRYFKSALWSPSYFAGSCGGASIETIKKYIEQQNTPD